MKIPTGASKMAATTKTPSKLARGIRERLFVATSGEPCAHCDVKGVCRSATA